MAEFSVGIGCIEFCIFDHVLYSLVGTVGGGVVYIDRFQLDVEGRYVRSIKSDNILSDLVNLAILNRGFYFVLAVAYFTSFLGQKLFAI